MKIKLNFQDGYSHRFEGAGGFEIDIDAQDILDLVQKITEASEKRREERHQKTEESLKKVLAGGDALKRSFDEDILGEEADSTRPKRKN